MAKGQAGLIWVARVMSQGFNQRCTAPYPSILGLVPEADDKLLVLYCLRLADRSWFPQDKR